MPIPAAASAGATHGAVVPIASSLLNSVTSTVYFGNIPQVYQDLMLVMTMRSDNTAFFGQVSYSIYLNGASGTANFSGTDLTFTPSTQFGSRRTTSTPTYGYQTSGVIPTYGSSGPNSFAGCVINILNYANSTTYKTALMKIGGDTGGTVSSGSAVVAGLWANTSPITSLLIGPYGNFAPGSTVSLYGIRSVGQ
jgi:hypothetical protein